MKLLRFLARYLVPYWPWGLVAGVATAVYAASTVALLQVINAIFDEILGSRGGAGDAALSALPPEASAQAEEAKQFVARFMDQGYEQLKAFFGVDATTVVYFVPILLVVVFLLRSSSDFVNGYSFQRIGFGATTDLRNALYDRTLEQSARFHSEHPSGELVSRVVHDVGVLQAAVSTRLVDLFQQSVTLVVLLLVLFSIDLKLALSCLILAPAVLYPIVRFSKGMRRTSHRAQERTADLANLVGEVSRGHRVVKAFGMEGFEASRFRSATARHLRVNLKGQLIANLSSPVVESLGAFGAAAFLVYAGRAIQTGSMDSATLITFLMGLYMLYDPIRKINKANMVVQQSLAGAQRVRSLLDLEVEIRDPEEPKRLDGFRDAIRYENVTFRYDHRVVLDGIDLEIRRGEVIAFVGPSGGGKTTLVNLLPRFFDVTGGRITLDGVDIRDLALADLRGLVSLVTQETVLFNDTVRNNIAYGRSELDLEAVRRAATAAFADEFIRELPNGYESVIGEGGALLSGGQRQRLAIARALLKDSPILILDEATSQLDTESESLVQRALANLMKDRTTLVVAHRLATVSRADRICVIEAGRVVEQGSHAELLEAGGTYRRLHELQFRD